MDDLPSVRRPRLRSTWSAATLSGRLSLARTSNDDTFRLWVTSLRSTRRMSTAVLPSASAGLLTASRAGDERARDQCAAQLAARRNPELREHAVQMCADRAMREVEALADLAVREALRRKLGDLQFLRGELIARVWDATSAPLARRTQLAARLLAPRRTPERVEGVARGAQDAA